MWKKKASIEQLEITEGVLKAAIEGLRTQIKELKEELDKTKFQLSCKHERTEIVYDAPGDHHFVFGFGNKCYIERCMSCDKDIKHLSIEQKTEREYELAKEALERMELERAKKDD
jgi:hypothetical protein